ncbi:hypothetical protein QD460_11360 [Rhizobium jaguaris]|uniref:hypothetical protein n=1 Tax=Rhizobium jaguaris TaxID=1312183 RepID=UPI0039BFBCFB
MSGAPANNPPAITDITIWEDDPVSGVFTTAPKPDITLPPLKFLIPGAVPPVSNDINSAAFRYWTAAEALKRGVNFWAPVIPQPQLWQRGGDTLEVHLDRWEDLEADYDRDALNFYHGPSASGIVYSCASPDVLCHELGHAILDAIKPSLWTAHLQEVASFHETFGDMSAILCALQLPSFRQAILVETNGNLNCDSRLSRIGQQLGTAVHALYPKDADPNCLRNASSFFSYCDPSSLPSSALTTSLSSNPHSFSRIFTGALFEALADMLTVCAANPNAPTPNELQAVSEDMRDIMASGVTNARQIPGYFAEVATTIALASAQKNPAYPGIFLGAFVGHAILSMETAATIQSSLNVLQSEFEGMANDRRTAESLTVLPASRYGLAEDLSIEMITSPLGFIARSARTDGKPMEHTSLPVAAEAFVDELFIIGQVDYNGFGLKGFNSYGRRRSKTHELVRRDGGLILQRRLFH